MKDMDSTERPIRKETPSGQDSHGVRRSALAGRYLGLCSTCGYFNGCTLRSSSESPVLFCEEFDSLIPGATLGHPVERESNANSSDGHIGLCINCDNRDVCGFHKPEGGIWNCEEYE